MSPNPRPNTRTTNLWRAATILYTSILTLGTHWPRLEMPLDPGGVWQLNKIVHAFAFGLLAAMLIQSRITGSHRTFPINALAATLLAAAYALLNEYSQQWVDRHTSLSDAVANLIGILAVYLIASRAAPTHRWPATPVYLCRALWLLGAPTLMLIATLPEGSPIIRTVVGWFTQARPGIDNWVHLTVALILTWMLALAAPAGRSKPALSVALTIAVMALAGPLVETVQAQTGRAYSLEDVYYHFLGLLAALTGWTLLTAITNTTPRITAR